MTDLQVFKTWIYISVWVILPVFPSSGQTLDPALLYQVIPSCESPTTGKPTKEDQYFYQLTIDSLPSLSEDFDISLNGTSIVQFHVEANTLPFVRSIGPLNHSGVGGTFNQYVLRSLTTGDADTLFLPELVCGYTTHNGSNRAGYYCEYGNVGAIAQVAPEVLNAPQIPEKTYVYVILDRSTQLVVDRNFSGHFQGLVDLSAYEIHAFAVNFESQADFINSVVIGQTLDQDDVQVCFGLCGIFDLTVDCSSFDLSLEKNVRDGFIYAIGDTVIFDITVHNEGIVTAYDILIEDFIPEELEFLPDLNPSWNALRITTSVDSLTAGSSVTIPLFARVSALTRSIEVENVAEILFATDVPGKTSPAFDNDSEPNNNVNGEDDIDEVVINVLENLCAATFEISVGNEPVCADRPLVLMSIVEMAHLPIVQFQWRKDGEIVSRDSMHIINEHSDGDYGEYSLTIVDAIGCSGTEFIVLEPVNTDLRLSCYTDIYLGINEECEIDILPSMLVTQDNVPAINDYTFEIRDESQILLDLSDLMTFGPGRILEGRIVNPCTGETMCWSNIHIENKGLPEFSYYNEQFFETKCATITNEDPALIIDQFNLRKGDQILNALQYEELLNASLCLQEWHVDVEDDIGRSSNSCDPLEVRRIYYIHDQERRYSIEEVTLLVQPIQPDSIIMPGDLANISCKEGLSPADLSSFPVLKDNGEEVSLNGLFENQSALFCNVSIRYNDQEFSEGCKFGMSKIVRRWSALDWCSNSFVEDVQFIFVVDQLAPEVEKESEQITLTTAPFACHLSIDLSDYLTVKDNCDPSPIVSADHYEDLNLFLGLGEHTISILATDQCGNQTQDSLKIEVRETTPPVAILKKNLSISLTEDMSQDNNYVLASSLDAGSHDHQCGPVEFWIARSSEILQVTSEGGQFELDGDLKNCMSDLSVLDLNNDLIISREELFRERVSFCCQDIGTEVEIVVRIMDQSGNVTEGAVNILVEAKSNWTECDDGDPCTVNDRIFGSCPCAGSPSISDFDQDNILDCMDDEITICLDGQPFSIGYDSLEYYREAGASGGACDASELSAHIAGEVRTTRGELIQDVVIRLNDERTETTTADGQYMFEENQMYTRYELLPIRDGDDLNGVTTLDLVMLQEYILRTRTIEDPYLMIAADINNDGRISALDLVDLQRALLGVTDGFEQNRSWRFVIENFEFDDMRDPFDYDEINVISNLDKDMMEENWIGIKIGDLNENVIPNELISESRSSDELTLLIENRKVEKDQEISIPIAIASKEQILGLQMGMRLNGLEIMGISSDLMNIEPSQFTVVKRGASEDFNMVWHHSEPVEMEDELFQLKIKSWRSGDLQNMISLHFLQPEALAVIEGHREVQIRLEFENPGTSDALEITAVELFQNQPNPFNGETMIQFTIPESGIVQLTFFDEAGQMILDLEDVYHKGINAIRLTRRDLKMLNGLIYYRMRYQDQTISRKMVLSR